MKDELADRVFEFIVVYTETHHRPPTVQHCAASCHLTTYRVRQALARLRQQKRISQTSLRLAVRREPKPRRPSTPKPRFYPHNITACTRILDIIIAFEQDHQKMPTIRELAQACGYAVSVQHRWLRVLEQYGYIERTGQARGIRLVRESLLQIA